jgi:hypothetical protein
MANTYNPRLPSLNGPVWTYKNDSWSWYTGNNKRSIVSGSDKLEYYWKWIDQQKTIPYPNNSVTIQGGLSSNTAKFLTNSIYNNVPDLRSETILMKKQISEYEEKLKADNLLPQDIRRDKI